MRRDTIGFVFQSFNLLPKLTVLDNVALPLAYKGTTLVRRQKRAAEMLERVGLADREYFLPRHLSGGRAQRVAIAGRSSTTQVLSLQTNRPATLTAHPVDW